MRHRNKKTILGRERAPRKALFRGLAISLIMHNRITTTATKARVIRPYVERLITRGRANTLASRRELLRRLGNEPAVKKVLTTLSPRYASRTGGYTRIVKLGRRQGDGGQSALIEFV